MEIERLAKKLEALIPDEIAKLLMVREMDPSMRFYVERRIMELGEELLGDSNGVLLSLPPRNVSGGTLNLGKVVYNTDRHDFGIESGELLRGMCIFGQAGMGKTNLAFGILSQLEKVRIPWLFLDWKRTARHWLPNLNSRVNVYTPGRDISPLPFNPFCIPPGVEDRVYVGRVIDALSSAYKIGSGGEYLIQKVLLDCYTKGNKSPGADEIVRILEGLEVNAGERKWRITALRALSTLSLSGLVADSPLEQESLAKKLLEENCVIELDALSQSSKKFLVPLLCHWLYSVRLGKPDRERLALAVVIEEAHNVLYPRASGETILEMLLRQGREVGLGFISVDQHPSKMSPAALGNSYISVCLNLKDSADIRKASSISVIRSDESNCFSQLPVGHGIVKMQGRWTSPFVLHIPHIEVNKGSMSDERLTDYVRQSRTLLSIKRSINREFGTFRHFSFSSALDGEGALALVYDIIRHSDSFVSERYKRIRIGANKGNRLKSLLVRAGIIEERLVQVGNTHRLMLRVSSSARRELGITESATFGSIAHEYWKKVWGDRLTRAGWTVSYEAPREEVGGRCDLLAVKGTEGIAVEIETGGSSIRQNVERDLASGWSVIVVATDKKAFIKCRKALLGIGESGRVRIVLQGGGWNLGGAVG